jgi:hypothetical protein
MKSEIWQSTMAVASIILAAASGFSTEASAQER